MALPTIDVEKVFSKFVEAYGGEVSDKEVAPDKESNADYIFHDPKVVAELKILRTMRQNPEPFNAPNWVQLSSCRRSVGYIIATSAEQRESPQSFRRYDDS